MRGGLTVYDFLKIISIQKLTKKGLSSLKNTIETIAEIENLIGHANSVKKRFEAVKDD